MVNWVLILLSLLSCLFVTSGSPASDSVKEIGDGDSSEHGGPPGRYGTTCNCGWANKAKQRVIGGAITDINEYPFMAYLAVRSGKIPLCGGSLITDQHVVTSAHCVIKRMDNISNVEVVFGEHNYSTGEESAFTVRRKLSKIDIYPAYMVEQKVYYDIAVLTLASKVEFNKFVGPVCLPRRKVENKGYLKIIGFGRTRFFGRGSKALKEVNVQVAPMELCKQHFNPHVHLDNPRLICTYTPQRGMGMGDSGGPVVRLNGDTNRYELVGLPVMAAMFQDEINRAPDMSTDVTSYLDWIQETIQASVPGARTCHMKP